MKKLYSAALAAAFVCGVALGVWTHTAHDAQSDPEPGQASSSSIARSYLTVLLRDTSRVAPQLHKLTDGSEYFGAGDAGAASIREDSGAAFAFAVLAVEYAAAPEPDATTRRASLVPSLARLRSTPPLRHADGESVAALRTVDVRYALGLIQFLVRSHRMGSGAALDGGHWGASDNSPVDAANL